MYTSLLPSPYGILMEGKLSLPAFNIRDFLTIFPPSLPLHSHSVFFPPLMFVVVYSQTTLFFPATSNFFFLSLSDRGRPFVPFAKEGNVVSVYLIPRTREGFANEWLLRPFRAESLWHCVSSFLVVKGCLLVGTGGNM